ncbi:Mur ligase family protein, partial [Klebsiella pneumoniae]
TRIGEAHLGYLGSMQAIAEEKAEIFSGLLPHGAAVLNADDEFFPLLSMIARKKGAEHIISYGQADGADVRLLNVHAHVETLTTEASFALEGKTYT